MTCKCRAAGSRAADRPPKVIVTERECSLYGVCRALSLPVFRLLLVRLRRIFSINEKQAIRRVVAIANPRDRRELQRVDGEIEKASKKVSTRTLKSSLQTFFLFFLSLSCAREHLILSTNVIEKAEKKKTARFSPLENSPDSIRLGTMFLEVRKSPPRDEKSFHESRWHKFRGFSADSRTLEYFCRFFTVFPSTHTLTLHSKRFSSLSSATLKPSTGSSFKLLYSKAKALTADEFIVFIVNCNRL